MATMNIYLDNAATSHPKPEAVYRAVDDTLRLVGGSPGRGGHRLALDASRLLFETREALALFFGIFDSSRIVFTANATQALNMALFGLLAPGDRVVTTSMEHNSVLRPLYALQENGVEVVKVAADQHGVVDPAALRAACVEKTRMLVLSHCSNVTGSVQAVEELGPWCRRQGIVFLVDAAQSAGLLPVQVETMAIDLLAVPGHKGLLGPQGTGFLYVREGLQLKPLFYGGTGGHSQSPMQSEEMPERLECGTHNLPGLAGLKAGVEFLQQTGLATVRAHERALLEQLREGLRAIPGILLYGPADSALRGGALSFNLAGRDPAEIGYLLDREFAICSRIGLHCAPDAHRTIGTFPGGTVRFSPGYFNTAEHIDTVLDAVRQLAKPSL
jgi:cysteine desulfurase / selenocysteine lyase